MDTHKTIKGRPVDMNRLRTENERAVAVGNMKVNAKGDLLGRGGKVEKTVQQRTREEKRANNIVNKASLKKPLTAEDEKDIFEENPTKPQQPAVKPKQNTQAKKKKERELPDGSIVVDDEE